MHPRASVTVALLLSLWGCAPEEPEVELRGEALGASLADVRCAGAPSTGAKGSFRHWTSNLIVALGSPRHRGVDLVATTSAATQTLRGEISYGINDKALEDEWVQLYGCRAGAWSYLGPVLTDGEGRFALNLSGGLRMGAGVSDLFVSVFGDRTSARFVSVVAPAGTPVVVSDIDGTLTASENAYPDSLITHATVGVHANAAAALRTLRDRGYIVMYLSTRGRYFTGDTRAWLAANGFPLGALRLAPSIVTLPGQAAADYKKAEIIGLALPVTLGVGNRDSDASAYYDSGIAPSRIFVKEPEFASELAPWVDGGWAVGFDAYAELLPVFSQL